MRNKIIFRLPFSQEIFTNDLQSDRENVSFTSFDATKVLNFSGNLKQISINELQSNFSFSEPEIIANDLPEESKSEYLDKIRRVIDFLKSNGLPKLVISRRKILLFDHPADIGASFLNLMKSYDNAFVYVFKTENECWIGAFSEVLGKYNKQTSVFETMSLAGTLALNEAWTAKELGEQETVTNYVKSVLNKYTNHLKVSETKDHISGNIKHLRTDFELKISTEKLDHLIQDLHPTPAVCGVPKEICKAAISEFENSSREYYAGYSRIETDKEILFFVNLRCAKLYKNAAELFAGGGITINSNPEKEWTETELKSQAILKNLAFIV